MEIDIEEVIMMKWKFFMVINRFVGILGVGVLGCWIGVCWVFVGYKVNICDFDM